MKKKLLYTASTSGHLNSFHLPYLEWFASHDWEVHTAGRGPAPVYPGAGRHFDIPFEKKITSPGNLREMFTLARIIRGEGYSMVVCNTSLAAFFTRMAVRLAGKGETRVVNICHGYLFDDDTSALKRSILSAAEKTVAGVTDDILVMNAQDEAIARKSRLCRGEVRRIDGMGIQLDRFSPPTDEEKLAARRSLGIPCDAFVLVYAAEFSARKNQSFLLHALSALPDDTVLLLPGRGELADVCKRTASELGIESRVFSPGFVGDIERCYRAADISVSASRIEGLPFNVMEGMACGLPQVVTAVKGHEDLVTDGANGLLYPYDDTDAFYRAVMSLRSDPELADRMGRASLQSAPRYSLERTMPDVITAILGNI